MEPLVMQAEVVSVDTLDIRSMDFYKTMLAACNLVIPRIRKKSWALVEEYHALGKAIVDNFVSTYGEATMEALAQDLGWSTSNLYRFKQFAEQFPTAADLQSLHDRMEAGGRKLCWSSARQELVKATDKPELYGGPKNVTEELMSRVEMVHDDVEALSTFASRDDITNGQKQEVAGVIFAEKQKLEELAMQFSKVSPLAKMQHFIYPKGGGLICCDVADIHGIVKTFAKELTQVESMEELQDTPKCFVVIKGSVLQREVENETRRNGDGRRSSEDSERSL